MTVTGRRLRNAAAAAVLSLLVTGTLAGQDDHFPFGPFRMYATATKPTGAVSFPVLEGVTTRGDVVRFRTAQFGLRRAELEGQIRLTADHDTLLGRLAESYARFQPDGPELAELRLVRVSRHIDGRRMVARTERLVAAYDLDGTR